MTAGPLAVLSALAVALALVAAGLARDPFRLIRAAFALQRWALGLRQRHLHAANHRWVYAERRAADPAAPTLVMLHGFTGSKENWYPLARALGRRYHLLIPDLPGWGASERRADGTYGFSEQAERVAAFLRAVRPDRSVVLLGHSMGGGIATLVAARHPEQVSHLALLNAAGVRFRDNAFGLAVLAGDNPFAVHDAASLRRYLGTVFFDRRAMPWIPWPFSAALIAKRRADAAFEQSVLDRIGRSEDSLRPGEEARHLRQPVLLLWGGRDAVIDSSALDAYAAEIPHARRVLLEECGHMTLAERPRAVAQAIVTWIEDTAAAPG